MCNQKARKNHVLTSYLMLQESRHFQLYLNFNELAGA